MLCTYSSLMEVNLIKIEAHIAQCAHSHKKDLRRTRTRNEMKENDKKHTFTYIEGMNMISE